MIRQLTFMIPLHTDDGSTGLSLSPVCKPVHHNLLAAMVHGNRFPEGGPWQFLVLDNLACLAIIDLQEDHHGYMGGGYRCMKEVWN